MAILARYLRVRVVSVCRDPLGKGSVFRQRPNTLERHYYRCSAMGDPELSHAWKRPVKRQFSVQAYPTVPTMDESRLQGG
jgi:hypothetical protein